MTTKDKHPIEELAEEIEERETEKDKKSSPKMKVSGRKVFELKKIIEDDKNYRHRRSDGQRQN